MYFLSDHISWFQPWKLLLLTTMRGLKFGHQNRVLRLALCCCYLIERQKWWWKKPLKSQWAKSFEKIGKLSKAEQSRAKPSKAEQSWNFKKNYLDSSLIQYCIIFFLFNPSCPWFELLLSRKNELGFAILIKIKNARRISTAISNVLFK